MASTDGFYPGEIVTVFTRDGRPAYVGNVKDIEPCDRLEIESFDGETRSVPATFVAHGDKTAE